MSEMNKELATKALKRLDEILDSNYHSSFRVIIGGGGAMILAHEYPGASVDLDGMMASKIESIKDSIEQVAIELGLSGDWLNPYYQAFTHYLPEDYGNRLVLVASWRGY